MGCPCGVANSMAASIVDMGGSATGMNGFSSPSICRRICRTSCFSSFSWEVSADGMWNWQWLRGSVHSRSLVGSPRTPTAVIFGTVRERASPPLICDSINERMSSKICTSADTAVSDVSTRLRPELFLCLWSAVSVPAVKTEGWLSHGLFTTSERTSIIMLNMNSAEHSYLKQPECSCRCLWGWCHPLLFVLLSLWSSSLWPSAPLHGSRCTALQREPPADRKVHFTVHHLHL